VSLITYDESGRKTSVTQGKRTVLISYLNPYQGNNKTDYQAVTLTYPDGFAKRVLVDALGRKIAQQVNTCADEPATYDFNKVGGLSQAQTRQRVASCSPGELMPVDHPFRTLKTHSYIGLDQTVHSQLQSSTDALGGVTRDYYDALGWRIESVPQRHKSEGEVYTIG
jgi:hypothetical protein